MHNNLFIKFTLLGILISLVIIAFKPTQQITIPSNPTIPSSTIIRNEIIQIAPNIIGVLDNGSGTGIRGQLLIFEYDSVGKMIRYSGTALDIQDYLIHPENYGVPNKKTHNNQSPQ